MSLTRELLKGLFAQLVSAAGGVENAGAVLGISFQRVSQLQTLGNDQLPGVMHIAALEAFVGRPVVTGYIAALCGPHKAADPMNEAVLVSAAATKVLTLVHDHAPAREIREAVSELKGEADDVVAAVEVAR